MKGGKPRRPAEVVNTEQSMHASPVAAAPLAAADKVPPVTDADDPVCIMSHRVGCAALVGRGGPELAWWYHQLLTSQLVAAGDWHGGGTRNACCRAPGPVAVCGKRKFETKRDWNRWKEGRTACNIWKAMVSSS
jgi:hypothetical protein